jgi:hypothetical protein
VKLDLVTIPNVELVSTGIEYQLMTGPVTFTEDDLRSIVESQDDPAIHSARLKLGHTDPRFNGPEFDGSPAYGMATNLRLGNNNQSVFCDYAGVPAWLADIMPVAYPSRSIEASIGVTTVTGKKWPLVLTAVALLGVAMPGCTVIEDLAANYGSTMPEGVVVEGGDMSDIAAAINVDDVRRSYIESLDQSQMWWWIRAIELDPMQLIVDDDDGSLFRVPFEVEKDEITFKDPKQIEIKYVDVKKNKKAASALVAGMVSDHEVAAIYASREESRGDSMNEKELKLRRDLGLPDTATDEQVTARIVELRAAAPGIVAESTEGEEETTEEEAEEEAAEGEALPEPEPPTEGEGAPAGTVTLDAAAYAQLKAGADAGLRAEAARVAAANEALIEGAIREGKFPPARKQYWANYLKVDPEGAKQSIASLSPGMIPVNERGTALTGETPDGLPEGLPDTWFPELPGRRAAAASGSTRVHHVRGD